MKTDSIFYQLFAEFPNIFFDLIGRTSNTQGYQFRSVEIKQTAFRIDGVFLPTENNPDKTIYFCEVQFQKAESAVLGSPPSGSGVCQTLASSLTLR